MGDRGLRGITNCVGATHLSTFICEYDALDQITQWGQIRGVDPAREMRAVYDEVNQLVAAPVWRDSGGGNWTPETDYGYGYDKADNRLWEKAGTTLRAAKHNGLNQVTNVAAGTATWMSGTVNEPATVRYRLGGGAVTNKARQTEGSSFSALLNNLVPGENLLTITATDGNTNTATNHYKIVIGTNSASQTLTYDADGNLTVDAVCDRILSWDAKNRLTQIARGTNTTQISYDGLDRWVQILEKAGTTTNSVKRFVWCGLDLCEERDQSGAVVKRFFPQGAEGVGGEKLFYTRDHLGSVRELVDNSGAVRASYSYDPWGRVTKTSGDRDAEFLFQGMYAHGLSELQFPKLGRPYSAVLGRWLRRDAIGERGGINIYGALANNPVNYTDPKGDNPLVIAAVVATLLLVEPDNADAPTPDSPTPRPPDLRTKLAAAAAVLGSLGPLFHESFRDSNDICPSDSGGGSSFDPNNKMDQRDDDWHYHWDKSPHDKRGGQPHWDRGHLRDGSQQEWSPDGVNWHPK